MALLPAVGFLGGKVGAKLGILSEQCFIAGTDVLVADAQAEGANLFGEKNIEDIRVGDHVWSKDENDPAAPLELKRVTSVFQHVAHDLQAVSLRDAAGNVERIISTDEHPYFVETKGWVGAADLLVGDLVMKSDGSTFTVFSNVDDKRPEGVLVYNFAVEGNHTYFVEDGVGENDWAWVHNDCSKALGRAISGTEAGAEGMRRLGYAAHHIIPISATATRAHVVSVFRRFGRNFDIDSAINGVWLKNGRGEFHRLLHGGREAHNRYVRSIDREIQRLNDPDAIIKKLKDLGEALMARS